MPLIDSLQILGFAEIATDGAAVDAGIIDLPSRGKGNVILYVIAYDATGGSSALATLSVRGSAGGAGTTIVADAALTTHTGATVVSQRTVAATGVTPAVTDDKLYLRITTPSGVAGTKIKVAIVGINLPG